MTKSILSPKNLNKREFNKEATLLRSIPTFSDCLGKIFTLTTLSVLVASTELYSSASLFDAGTSDKQDQSSPMPAPLFSHPSAQGHKGAPLDLPGKYQVDGPVLFGSALYWKAYEEGLDYVIKNNGATAINNDGTVERPKFDWSWGFRVGVGYAIPTKCYDVSLCWTRYTTDGTVSDHVSSPTSLFSVWSITNGVGNQFEFNSKAHTRLRLNRVDLGLDTTFAPRRFLDITPRVSLSALWIHQKFDFNLSGGPGMNGLLVIDDEITMKNDFFGIGPKLGLDTLWSIGYGFGIVGNFNLSILYGFFDITQDEDVTFTGTPPNTYLDIDHNSYHDPKINFDLFLGLRWDHIFCSGKYHLFLEAGWENMIFLGQNQLMRFSNTTYPGNNNLVKGDLSIEGLTMSASFTF